MRHEDPQRKILEVLEKISAQAEIIIELFNPNKPQMAVLTPAPIFTATGAALVILRTPPGK